MIVAKPWGHEDRFAITDKYVGKILVIKQGHSLSLQHHEKKDETIRLLSGQLALRIGWTVEEALQMMPVILEVGDSYHIPPGLIHRMIALENCEVLEVSTPELDDVIRHQDLYGRIEK